MIYQDNSGKKIDTFGKVLGRDSKLKRLVELRKALVDELVLNTREKREAETKRHPKPRPRQKT